MICGNCGGHTHYSHPFCHLCQKPIHKTDCTRTRETCKCYTENLKAWETKSNKIKNANADGEKSKSSKKTNATD